MGSSQVTGELKYPIFSCRVPEPNLPVSYLSPKDFPLEQRKLSEQRATKLGENRQKAKKSISR